MALALLAVVARTVPWGDRLVWHTAGGETVRVRGEIQGEWSGEAIGFRVDPRDQSAGDGFPEVPPDGVLRVERLPADAAPGTPGWTWQPGLPRVFREVDPEGLFLCLAALLLGQIAVTTRWWRLLAVAGCPTRWRTALRLTFLGLFFNLLVPGGLTGGDVVKSVLVTREHPKDRTKAFISVYVDRLLGLFALAALAAVVILVEGQAFAVLRAPVLVFLGAGLAGALVYSNRPLRAAVRVDALVARLPLGETVKRLDEAVLVYSRRPLQVALALVLSLVNHVAAILGILALGRAFGDTLSAATYFVVVPVANTVSALPGAPGGWGFGEAAYGFLFDLVGGSATIGIAVSVTFRLCMMTLGLVGGALLLVPSGRAALSELEPAPRDAAADAVPRG